MTEQLHPHEQEALYVVLLRKCRAAGICTIETEDLLTDAVATITRVISTRAARAGRHA